MKRREFLKGLGIVAGAGTAAVTTITLVDDKRNLSQLADFNDALLRRSHRFEWWELTFSSSDKFDPSNEKQLIVEIGEFKFQLSELDKVDISRFGKHGKYMYKLSGTGWESI